MFFSLYEQQDLTEPIHSIVSKAETACRDMDDWPLCDLERLPQVQKRGLFQRNDVKSTPPSKIMRCATTPNVYDSPAASSSEGAMIVVSCKAKTE